LAYLPLFVYLQLLDVLTTLIGFSTGATEGSPFIRQLIRFGPVAGVVFSKFIALGLFLACLRLGRTALIRWINLWFGALVVWNLCLILRVLTAPAS
jgi:hypothetical protein